jgi:hypothetical protein
VFLQATTQPAKPAEPVVAPKPKSSSEFANLDAFLGTPSATHGVSNSSSPSQQLHGANFFSVADDDVRHASSAPVTPAQSRPDTPSSTSIKSADNETSKHKDLKSSILSLYNSPRANASASGLVSQPVAANSSYANNLGSFQQQLSGLSMGPPSGMIPQPPPQQANQYQNVWGGFQESSSQQAWSNSDNDFTSFNQAPAFQQQNSGHMPQGGQFFSTDYNNRPASNSSPSNPPQRPNFE